MMKSNQLSNTFKTMTLAIVLAFAATANTTMAADEINASSIDSSSADDNAPYVNPITEKSNNDWMSAIAAEFVALDKTGNGLLLPYEASKDKAFNKKTFANADVDKDGYIDQHEYINFKTGKLPTDVLPANNFGTSAQ